MRLMAFGAVRMGWVLLVWGLFIGGGEEEEEECASKSVHTVSTCCL